MLATVMQEYGGPEVLVPTQVADPSSRSGWVTVKLRASALNWHDVLVRRGLYGSPLPHVPGADGAGVRGDTGEEVIVVPSLWWGPDGKAPGVGWEILGDRVPGTYAELVCVPEEVLVPRPVGLTWEQAAALPLVGLTAFRALFTRGRLQAGEALLILGAGGGLSTMAVALAAAVGARPYVTSSSRDKIASSVELGAVGGVLHTQDGWAAEARELIGQQGFDLVLDAVGTTWPRSLEVLRPGGRLVTVGATGGREVTLPVPQVYFGQHDILGSTMGGPDDLRGLLDLWDRYRVARPPIHRVYPLVKAADAHRDLEAGHHHGKLVLVP